MYARSKEGTFAQTPTAGLCLYTSRPIYEREEEGWGGGVMLLGVQVDSCIAELTETQLNS